ncbi:hypothetical protein ES703_85486 [subsurface metagenome]
MTELVGMKAVVVPLISLSKVIEYRIPGDIRPPSFFKIHVVGPYKKIDRGDLQTRLNVILFSFRSHC